MVIDAFGYNGEKEVLEIRLGTLWDSVDEFLITESISTFGGTPKNLHFAEQVRQGHFLKYLRKIRYVVNEDAYTAEEMDEARNSPNTGGDPRWMHEYLHKEFTMKTLNKMNIKDDDVVFIGDVDEIWDTKVLNEINGIKNIKLRVYTYYLNLRSSEVFWGTIVAKWKDLKDKNFNSLRKNQLDIEDEYGGWHFTNQGGIDAVHKKITDQYNHETLNIAAMAILKTRFGEKDYIGRDFKLEIDETEWPPWLTIHRKEFTQLLK